MNLRNTFGNVKAAYHEVVFPEFKRVANLLGYKRIKS
jgi:hypothetical protein